LIHAAAAALPTKPLNAVALADADTASSLTYINQKLREASMDYTITPEEQTLVERVGGRASDLETVCNIYFFFWPGLRQYFVRLSIRCRRDKVSPMQWRILFREEWQNCAKMPLEMTWKMQRPYLGLGNRLGQL